MESLKITNDLGRINRADALYKIYINSEFSVVFILLLTSSIGVCTMGLLLGSAPIVIGGMLMSPLMWPLMKLALGIASGTAAHIRRALFLLLLATGLSILISFSITYLSPVKFLNNEIISRTNPTLLDIIVAIAAGGIAALAISQPRISESIAGVAIATSILPPLCVAGVGLALFNFQVFTRGMLLFVSSAISIIFVSSIVFSGLKIRHKTDPNVQRKGVVVTFILMLLTAIPLFILLKQYSFKTLAYNNIKENLETGLEDISSAIQFDNFRVTIPAKATQPILVEADLLLPEELSLDYSQQQKIKAALETAVGREIDITLRIQKTISIISEEDRQLENTKRKIGDAFVTEVGKISSDLSVSALEITKSRNSGEWKLKAVLRSNPDLVFTTDQKDALEKAISEQTGETILLNLEIIPRILIQKENLP